MTDGAGAVLSRQSYTPWGEPRVGTLPETTLDYTGQLRDDTGLLYYNARYYDPVLARFVSPDTIVPGTSAGSGGAAATVGSGSKSNLTVDFHEGDFLNQLNAVNAQRQGQGFWFELDGEQQEDAEAPSVKLGIECPQNAGFKCPLINGPCVHSLPPLDSTEVLLRSRWSSLLPPSATGCEFQSSPS